MLKTLAEYKKKLIEETYEEILNLSVKELNACKSDEERKEKVDDAYKEQISLLDASDCEETTEIQAIFANARKRLIEHEVHPTYRGVPIIAFFGTKGGVGKSTISNEFAEIVTRAKTSPNVLLIDFDIHARSTTITTTGGNFNCKTVVDCIEDRSTEAEVIDITKSKSDILQWYQKHSYQKGGKLYLFPSATKDQASLYDIASNIDNKELYELTKSWIDNLTERYDINCVVIDCTAIIDRLTATAAHLSTLSPVIGEIDDFMAGQTTYESLLHYIPRIKTDFFDDFNMNKLKAIYNKVRSGIEIKVPSDMELIANVPEVKIDIVENLKFGKELEQMVRKYYFWNIVKSTFDVTHPELVSDSKVILPEKWRKLIELAPEILKSRQMKFCNFLRMCLPFGAGLAIFSAILKFVFGIGPAPSAFVNNTSNLAMNTTSGVTPNSAFNTLPTNYLIVAGIGLVIVGAWTWNYYKESKVFLEGLVREGERFLFPKLTMVSGRRISERLCKWEEKVDMSKKKQGGN